MHRVSFGIRDMLHTIAGIDIAVAVQVRIRLSKPYIRQRHSHMSGYTAPQSMLDMVLFLEKIL